MTTNPVAELEAILVAMSEDDYRGAPGDEVRAQLAAVRPRRSAAAIAADYAGEAKAARR